MTTHSGRAVILSGGELHTKPSIGSRDLVLAADSGYDHALALDIAVDVLVGDLDSISPTGLAHARASGVEIEKHPADKDSTDLELAMTAAVDRDAASIAIYGGEGGRIAHLLTVALSQSNPRWATNDVSWHTRTGIVRTATQQHAVALTCAVGDAVTLAPNGEACGVTTEGLRWALNNACLDSGSTLGVSNEATSTAVRVELRDGAVLVIHEEEVTE